MLTVNRIAVLVALNWSLVAFAQDLTREQIMQVIDATDKASVQRDTAGIGTYLASDFYKFVDVPDVKPPVTVRLDKQQYLEIIDKGWQRVEDYSYERSDVVINVASDGQIGESNSTILETMTVDGEELVSKIREYATYKLENGRPVIIMIDSHKLVGDSTPE